MPTLRRISASLAASLIWIPLGLGVSAQAQTTEPESEQVARIAVPVIPQQVRYSGKLATRTGDTVEAVFSIYAAPEGGDPLWTETQKLTVDVDGSYTVLLGSVSKTGVPQTLFAGGAARWLGVSVERAPELERVLLSSVPYAMKSADAQALAGHPAGDFVTQGQLTEQFSQFAEQHAPSTAIQPLTSGTITGSGTTGTIPEFTGANTIGNSEIVQVGTQVGINEPTPAATLDVNGTGQIRGNLTLPALSTATTSAGTRSQLMQWSASTWSTTAAAAVNPSFRIYALPVGNNTASPSGLLNLQYQLGTAETSIFSIASNGAMTAYGGVTEHPLTDATSSAGVNSPPFELVAGTYSSTSSKAVAQNFAWQVIPTGNNTSTPSSNLALLFSTGSTALATTGFSISPKGLINWAPGQTFPGTGTITGVTAGTGLTGGGTSGSVTLNLDTTQVPLLTANNNFAGALTAASLSSAGTVNAGSYDLGGSLFDSGSLANENAFLGFAGNGNATAGSYNTAAGYQSLQANSTGNSNAAFGLWSLLDNTSGSSNTAVGAGALLSNQQGSYNTATGDTALAFNTAGVGNTASGFGALGANSTGDYNTALGYNSLQYNANNSDITALGANAGIPQGTNNLYGSTAIGYGANVNQSNALVLGQTTPGSPGATWVDVGVGTANPVSAMEISVNLQDQLGPTLTLTNPGGTSSAPGHHPAEASIDFKTYLHTTTVNSPTSRIEAVDDDYGNDLFFYVKQSGSDNSPLVETMFMDDQEVDVLDYFHVLNVDPMTPYAAEFDGSVYVEKTLDADIVQAEVKYFKIDDPADPADKYLYHSSVESSEMMNIYTGNVVTDKLGLATVKLPDWFQTENADFRYQLTVIGRFAQAIVSKEIENNQFQIATNASFVKVSWQVTGIRQDAYAKAHPLVPEQEKPVEEKGYYMHPELYGQPAEKQIRWAHDPDRTGRLKANREAASARSNSSGHGSELPASERPPVPVFRPPVAQRTPSPAYGTPSGRSSTIPAPPGSVVR